MKAMFVKFAGVLVVMLMGSGSQAATLIVDQTGSPVVAGGYGGNVVQSFTPSQDNIVGVDAHYYSFAGTENISVSLWDIGTWTGSGFTGSPLHTDTLTGVSACLSTAIMCTEFRWEGTPVSIVPGQLYYLQFAFGGGAIGAGVTNPYSGGQTLAGSGNLFSGNADLAFRTYYDATPVAAVPVPAAVWLFGSGLLGLVGLARRKRT